MCRTDNSLSIKEMKGSILTNKQLNINKTKENPMALESLTLNCRSDVV